jgi:hypothetical protein
MDYPTTQPKLRDVLDLICYSLAAAFNAGGSVLNPGVRVLTEEAVDEWIPGEVFNIAVSAGWVEPPEEVQEGDGPVLGDFIVKDWDRERFVSLLSRSLSVLRKRAEKDAETVSQKQISERAYWLEQFTLAASRGRNHPDRSAKTLIDEYLKTSQEVFSFKELAYKASPYRRKLDGASVSAASITRIYRGDYVADVTREAVASALDELLKLTPPCSRHDLLPQDRKSDTGEIK